MSTLKQVVSFRHSNTGNFLVTDGDQVKYEKDPVHGRERWIMDHLITNSRVTLQSEKTQNYLSVDNKGRFVLSPKKTESSQFTLGKYFQKSFHRLNL